MSFVALTAGSAGGKANANNNSSAVAAMKRNRRQQFDRVQAEKLEDNSQKEEEDRVRKHYADNGLECVSERASERASG